MTTDKLKMATAITEEDAVQAARYLADQLDTPARAAFEQRLLAEPALGSELELQAQLKQGLAGLKASGDLQKILATPAKSSPPRFAQWAVAASIVGVLALGSLWWAASRTGPGSMLASTLVALADGDDSGRFVVTAPVAILRTRGLANDAEITLPAEAAGPSAVPLRILPEDEPALPPYRIEFRRLDDSGAVLAGPSLARLADLVPDTETGYLAVYLNPSGLQPGNYELQVQGSSEAAIDSRLVVKVKRPD